MPGLCKLAGKDNLPGNPSHPGPRDSEATIQQSLLWGIPPAGTLRLCRRLPRDAGTPRHSQGLAGGSSELSQMWEQEPFDSLNSGVRQGCLLCQGVRLEHPSAFSCTLSVPPNSTAGAGLFCEQGLKFQL